MLLLTCMHSFFHYAAFDFGTLFASIARIEATIAANHGAAADVSGR
jgi:hypothetical protein